MSETENVSKKLIEDAKNTRNEILAEAREKAKSVLLEAKSIKESIEAKGKTLADEAYRQKYDFIRAQMAAQLDQKLLNEKIKIVDEVIKNIADRLENLGADDLKKPLLKFARELNFKNAVYQLGKDEKKITDLLVSEVFGAKKLLKSTQTPDFARGLKITDERKEYYFSETTLVDINSEDMKMEISKILFA